MDLPRPFISVLRIAFGTISVLAILASIGFGWLFYRFYLKWIPLFEEGRYFDPGSGVVYHDTGFVFSLFMAASLLVGIVAASGARVLKNASNTVTMPPE